MQVVIKLLGLTKLVNFFKIIDFSDTTKLLMPCDVLLFCHDVDRGVTLDNKAYSSLLDSTREELEARGLSCISIAHPWSRLTGRRGFGSPVSMNRSYFISLVFEKIYKLFGLGSSSSLYERIFNKTQPKVVITIGCTDDLCEAARKLNIFHVELLHGLGYTFVPWGWDRKENRHLPQAIASLDASAINAFSVLAQKGVIIKQISHPFLKRFLGKGVNVLPAEWALTGEKNKKEILVTLQWGHASDIEGRDPDRVELSNGLFYTELEEVVRLTRNSVFWRFRLHPVQYRQREKYKSLFDFMNGFVFANENSEWVESTYKPLHSLLLRCDGHVTMNSKSSYEAACFGVKTIALSPLLRGGGLYESYFEDLVEEGYLDKVEINVNTVLAWALNVNKKEPRGEAGSLDDFSEWVQSEVSDF